MAFINPRYTSRNRRIVFAVIFIVILLAWRYYQDSGKPKQESQVSEIDLTITNSEGISYVYLKELQVGALKVIDSLNVQRESKGKLYIPEQEAGFYVVQAGQQPPIVLLIEPHEKLSLVMQAGSNNSAYTVRGSPGSALLREYQVIYHSASVRIDSLKRVFETVRKNGQYPEMRPRLDAVYKKIFDEQQAIARSYINRNLQSLASLYIINQRLGPQRLFNMEQDFNLFNRLDSAIMRKYPANKHALDNHQRVSDAKRKLAEQQITRENVEPGQK